MVPSANKIIRDKKEISSIHARIKLFEHPFTTQVSNPKVETFCSQCMRAPPQGQKLLKCAGCDFVRYCCKDCQRLAWKVHRPECRRLKASFPNLPLTEVLFLSKIMDRVLFLKLNGDQFGWEKERKFSDLMGHQDDIRNDPEKMKHFEKIYTKMSTFRKEEMISKDDFFEIFCKAAINSHSIHTNAGTEIGMALDLGISRYNHSCRPTCTIVFDGYRVCLRPLVTGVDASDPEQAFISYIDVGRSKYMRCKDLKIRWYFDCECTRCTDPEDDLLTAIKCANPSCDEGLITSEIEEPCYISCKKCKTVTDDTRVKEAQELMKFLPSRFDPNCPADISASQLYQNFIQDLLTKAEKLLHPTNVYVSRLRTALMQVTGTLTVETMSSMHREIYSNYKMCFPKADRHVGYQLLHIIKALIEKGQREEAVHYAFDAMNIFEVCFGLDHPYYLQTLALWTFLDQKAEKTDEQLIALTHFSDNRPIDIISLLQKANMMPKVPNNGAPAPTGNGQQKITV